MRFSTSSQPALALVSGSDLESALDRRVLRALSGVSVGLILLFSLLFVLHLLQDLPRAVRAVLLATDLLSLACFTSLRVALTRGRIPSRYAHPATLLVVALLVVAISVAFTQTAEPFYLHYLAILVIGCSAVMLSLPWLVASIGVAGAGWVAIGLTAGLPADFYSQAVPLLSAILLALAILHSRIQAIARTEEALAEALAENSRRQRAHRDLLLLQRAVEQSGSLVIITDREGTIEYVNPKFLHRTGYSVEEVLGKKPSIIKSDRAREEIFRDLWRTITAGENWQGELRNRTKDGADYWVISSVSPIKDSDGAIRHFLAVQEDITERKKIEERLAQSQKLESVGQLVSGVAHDFNNLLTAIIGFSELGLEQAGNNEAVRHTLYEIKKAGESAGELTRQLLAFSRRRRQEPAASTVNLNTVIAHTEELLYRTIREDIELDLSLDPELGATRVDPDHVRQVLINLAVNARDALPDGGRMTIETRNVVLDDRAHGGRRRVTAGPYVRLTICDDGLGMDEQTKRRAFEPFFTTKSRGHGTGLGLATVRTVVEESGGFVNLLSEPGVGTCFEIYLPHVPETEAAGPVKAGRKAVGGSETILLVEDNNGVREITERTLRAGGYRVFSCANPEEALQVFDQSDIDLLLTDMVMPGTNGSTLAQALKARKPSLRILLMSGYTGRSMDHTRGLDPQTPFLQKPFHLDELFAKVRQSLENPQ